VKKPSLSPLVAPKLPGHMMWYSARAPFHGASNDKLPAIKWKIDLISN
jgi:hypothetical protein